MSNKQINPLFKQESENTDVKMTLKVLMFLFTLVFFTFLSSVNAHADIVYIYQDIEENTTWSSGNEYIICEIPGSNPQRGPVVKPGVTLTIEDGAIVKLDSNRVYIEPLKTHTHHTMVIQGNINATGAIFTARTDYWNTIKLIPGEKDVPVNATFTNCTFEKGGRSDYAMITLNEQNGDEIGDGQTINLTLSGCTLQDSYNNNLGIFSSFGHHKNVLGTININNTTFNNLGYGVLVLRNYQDDIDVEIDRCEFTNLKGDAAVVVQDCNNVTVTNNTFTDMGPTPGTRTPLVLGYNYSEYGGYSGGFAKGNVTITGNTFNGSQDTIAYPIEFHAAANINPGIENSNNSFPGYPDSKKYSRPFLHIRKNHTRWGDVGLAYLLDHDVLIGVAYPDTGTGGSLTIDPGISVIMTGEGGIYARNTFIAMGTKDKPIIFNTIGSRTANNRINIDSCLGDIILRYCEFSNMEYGLQGGSNSGTEGIKSFIVENSSFSNMTKSGVLFYDDRFIAEGKGWIKDSIFENNGEHGLYASSWSAPNRLEVYNSIFRNNAKDGVHLKYLSHLKLDHCLIYSNGDNGVHVVDSYSKDNPPSIINCTIAKNRKYGLYNREDKLPYANFAYGATVKNSIISGNGEMDMYNGGYDVMDGSVTYSCITDSWHYSTGRPDILGVGCITKEALFVNLLKDDFHLKSDGGRWNGNSWVKDDVSSPCIDAGDPEFSFINEPEDNGERINIGCYGNTGEASKKAIKALDTTPPTWGESANIIAQNITASTADLTWTSATDAAEYRVYKDLSQYGFGDWSIVATTPTTAYTVLESDYLDFGWGARIKVEAIDSSGNRTNNGPVLYVRTPRPQCIITLDPQGGEVSPSTLIREFEPFEETYYGTYYEQLPIPTRAGYTFEGWYFNPEGTGDKINNDTKITIKEDHTLYAKWNRDLTQYEDKGSRRITDKVYEWKIEFSHNINFSTVNSTNIYIIDELGNKLDFIEPVVENGKYVKLQILNNQSFEFNHYYSIIIEKNVESEAGCSLTNGVKMEFIVVQ